jgi:putative ABC transport system permease protein
MASTNMIVGPGFKENIPEINDFVRMTTQMSVVKVGKETFNQDVLWADESFFSVFSFPLIKGQPSEVLSDISSVVITDELSKRYFGTTDVIGKTIELDMGGKFEPFTVSGVAKRSPQNSSIQFDILFPYKYIAQKFPDNDWLGFYINTFLVLHPEADYKNVEPKLDEVFLSKVGEEFKRSQEQGNNSRIHFGLQPLMEIHMDTTYGDIRNGLHDGSNPIYSYILSAIALFVLVIACVNFINLTTASSIKRGREIGIRKVVGGKRGELVRQFLVESFTYCFFAFVFAILIVQLTLPLFNELANKRLSFTYLLDVRLGATYIALLLVTGVLAGLYPAIILSSFNPVQTLYNRVKLTDKNYLARVLIVLQFALAAFLMIVTGVVYTQFNYLINKDLGYNDEDLVKVYLGRRWNPELIQLFKDELAKENNIERIATKDPSQNYTLGNVMDKKIYFAFSRIDENYIPTLEIPIVKGRNFSKQHASDGDNAIIVNESFVKEAGWKEPIGQTVFNVNGNEKYMTVVGVVKDHHFVSLKEKIKPQLFIAGGGELWIKVKAGRAAYALQTIERTYRKLIPTKPFEYEFMNSLNAKKYEAEAKWKQIITASTLITIFVSCIGLFGLTLLSTQKRIKEIGIRKVFGASVRQIISLLSLNFLKLVALAFLLAVPLAWYASHKWLENFAYQIELSWTIFSIPGVLLLLIGLLTVSFQAVRAALANPSMSLRNE